jgi:ABC-2 type transport system ATP-binding protein
VTPQELSFPATLTVREIISFVSSHYVHPKDASTLLGSFGLSDLANRQIGGLSSGQRRRLAIAVAFAGNPRAVVLDEPTAGLDVESRRAAWRTLKEFTAGGRSVLLTTHYLEEAEAFAERIVLINNGRVVVDGSVDQIRSQVVQRRVRFRCAEMPLFAPGVSFEVEGDRYTILADDPDRLVRDLVRRDVPFTGLEVSAASFEEAFLKIIETR